MIIIGAKTFGFASVTKTNAQGDLMGEQVWLLDRRTVAKALLPTPPPVRSSPLPFDRFVVSPNERVLIGDRKVGSGRNAAYVWVQAKGLHFRLTDRASLNERIYRKFGPVPEAYGKNGTFTKTVEFVLFQKWQDSRKAWLACLYGEGNNQVSYFVSLNTHTGTLSNYHRVSNNRVVPLEQTGGFS